MYIIFTTQSLRKNKYKNREFSRPRNDNNTHTKIFTRPGDVTHKRN